MSCKEKYSKAQITDSSLYKILEMGDFQELKTFQENNESNSNVKYFLEKVSGIFTKKYNLSIVDPRLNDLLNSCEEKLGDLMVSMNDFTVLGMLSTGGQSIVYRGVYKYINVAVKKVSLNALHSKQLVF